jgi:glycosyltransferase involved in cell wall biosynthesis
MKIFMLGWEFPPFISGGLGTACYGLTRGLDRLGVEVFFVLPRASEPAATAHVRLLSGGAAQPRTGESEFSADSGLTIGPPGEFRHTRIRAVEALLRPYAAPQSLGIAQASAGSIPAHAAAAAAVPQAVVRPVATRSVRVLDPGPMSAPGSHYGGDMFREVERYAALVCEVAAGQSFDVVHAHDWMTFPAGVAVSRMSGKPLIVHIHSTEFDRSGLHVNQRIYDIERMGMHVAAWTIAVSHMTRSLIVRHYGVDARRVVVVHNAIDEDGVNGGRPLPPITRNEKIVLFLGRITMQKGPEYFLMAAKRVLEVMDNVRFIMAGSGDMIRRMVELAAHLGIGHKVLFTGFLNGGDVKRVFRMADLYVMPSVSEPFGIAPLEAMSQDVPVLISKQSGVAEVITHALKVDFWDIDEMANKIVAVLRHPPLQATLRDHGSIEVRRFSWTDAAANCLQIYEKARNGRTG